MKFGSDNCAGTAPEILEAIAAAARDNAPAYGSDAYSRAAEAAVNATFERTCATFLVATGTAANALALAALAPPGHLVFCHEEAHIVDDECAAPEFFGGGTKLIGIPGIGGKIPPDALRETLARYPRGQVRHAPPSALSLSQATEAGTLYTLAEIAELAEIAHAAGLSVHMDGARFANAVAALDVSPAETTWKAGVDVLSLGATKNGALACEAVVFFDPARAADFAVRRKRGGQTLSKGKFLGAQMEAWFQDDLWLKLARRANFQAQRLARGLERVPGLAWAWPVEANELFPILPDATIARLLSAGAVFHAWTSRGHGPNRAPRPGETCLRLVTSFETTDAEIDAFVAAAV